MGYLPSRQGAPVENHQQQSASAPIFIASITGALGIVQNCQSNDSVVVLTDTCGTKRFVRETGLPGRLGSWWRL